MYVDEDEKAFTCQIKVSALFDVHQPVNHTELVSEFYTTALCRVQGVQKCQISIGSKFWLGSKQISSDASASEPLTPRYIDPGRIKIVGIKEKRLFRHNY